MRLSILTATLLSVLPGSGTTDTLEDSFHSPPPETRPGCYWYWINDNVSKGADIMMKELRWPQWDKGTYYCQYYSYFFPDRHCTFYGGVATHALGPG